MYQQPPAEVRKAEQAQIERLKQYKEQQERRRREERDRALIAEPLRRAKQTSQGR